ncbi:MAG: sensor histidine kinase [Usitatibacter sp.]
MAEDTPNPIPPWLARFLPAQFCADAALMQEGMKRHWKGWLAAYLVAVVVGAIALQTFVPKVGWARSFLVMAVLCIGLAGTVASAWFGYQKYTGPRGARNYVIFVASIFAGGLVGMLVESMGTGGPFSEVDAHKLGLIFGAVTIVGAVLVLAIAGISRARSRQVAREMAVLQDEADRERLARQSVQAELKLLQAQVEPHFLFNTLANLRFLVQTQSPHALPMLDHLIHYLRTALPEIRAESSTVGREIELARAYLEILRIRMGGALDITTEVPPELAKVPFPPLMLLTLVENAIKHGIAPMGRGRIALRVTREGDRLLMRVEDDGRGLAEPIGQGVGLGNVRERLHAIHGAAARLELRGREGGGTVATIEVPL